MKKILIIFLCLFIVTGCKVTYDIDLSKAVETVIVKDSNDSNNINLYNVYSKKPIPLSNYSPIISESNKKEKGILYYDTFDISSGNEIGLKFVGKYNKDVSLSNSFFLSYGTKDGKINKNGDSIIVQGLHNIKLFEQFEDLEQLTVNVRCGNKVIKHNADKVGWNTYTWVFTRDNYIGKTISIEFKEDNFWSSNVNFIIGLIIVVFLSILIFFVVKVRNKKVNNL